MEYDNPNKKKPFEKNNSYETRKTDEMIKIYYIRLNPI